jgi:sulfur carrier protein
MEITINNEQKIISDDSLSLLLNELLGEKTKGIAIAVNNTIVPKNEWQTISLKANDVVLIIKATQGG